ncbi:MAG TPA: hypothetical protein PK609_01005 [Candidatus Paceibacterota bacterium]|nr:hypothetical protein [Candidatus Paceibacterota bacterium]
MTSEHPKPVYYAVSLRRLILLSLISAGLYDLYWMYRNWKAIQKAEEREILPFWRAFFGIFYCYPLFRHMVRSFRAHNHEVLYSPTWLAVLWVVLVILGKLSTLPALGWFGYLVAIVSYLSFVALIPLQKTVNEYAEHTLNKELERKLSTGEFVIITLSALVWVFFISVALFA